MKKIITLTCLLVFSGFFFYAQEAQGVIQSFYVYFDELDYVGQGAYNLDYTTNRLTISGKENDQVKIVNIDIPASSTNERDYLEFCKKAALLALSNSDKYQLDILAYGDVVSSSVEVDLSTNGYMVFCNLNRK